MRNSLNKSNIFDFIWIKTIYHLASKSLFLLVLTLILGPNVVFSLKNGKSSTSKSSIYTDYNLSKNLLSINSVFYKIYDIYVSLLK